MHLSFCSLSRAEKRSGSNRGCGAKQVTAESTEELRIRAVQGTRPRKVEGVCMVDAARVPLQNADGGQREDAQQGKGPVISEGCVDENL